MGRETRMPHWPRLMREETAAAYCGVSEGTFRTVMKLDADAPKAAYIRRCKVYLKDDLDAWIDRRFDRGAGVDEFEKAVNEG